MKKWLPIVVLLLAGSAFADYLDENTRVLKLDLIVDSNSFDDSLLGVEAGFGVAIFDQSVVGLFLGAAENESDGSFRFGGLEVEEHYRIHNRIIPFAGAAAGFASTDLPDQERQDGFMGRLAAGVKLKLSESWSLSAAFRYWLATDYIFIDGETTDRARADVAAGLRFIY